MEPVTHFLTGACIGRAGLNRKTAYATLAAVLAAEAADLDIVWGFAGPVASLQHHRGITHTFWAVPVVAGVVVGAVWLIDRWRNSRKKEPASPPTQPIHWGWLYLTAVLASLSHILLDWTNNYGVRPLFPLNPRWYAGSFMFIVEPILYLLFFLALFMPWVLGLADREIGARREPFRGRGWAVFAIVGMLILGCVRWAEHAHTLALIENTDLASEPILRAAAEPYPINPFHWHAIFETPDFYQTAEINALTGAIQTDPLTNVLYKPNDTPAVEAAKRTYLGRIYLDWGTWAVVRDLGHEPIAGLTPPNLPPTRTWTTVEFSDLRFHYTFLTSLSVAGRSPLGGWVYIVDGRDDAGEVMGGRVQH